MNIEYVARNYSLDDKIREYAESKLGKVIKFLQEPVEIRLLLEQEKYRHIAELHVAHRFGVLQAKEETESMPDAVNLAVDKVEKQARRARKKYMDKRRRQDRGVNGQQWPVEVLEAASVRTGRPRIVRTTTLQIKPMGLDEAVLQLEESKNDFVVFRDSKTDRVSVLYKRRDDHYGLISPE